jgi:hypothetical protein
MAIPPTAQFSHSVALRVGHDGVWRGTAEPADQDLGLVGDAPAIELTDSMLTLERRVGPAARLVRAVAGRSQVAKALFEVGEAPETVLQNGDVLHLDRGAMAELSLVLMREGSLVMALGAVTKRIERAGVAIEIDPRADDVRFNYMRSLLDEPKSLLVWLDPQAGDYDRQLAELDRIPAHVTMVSIAARCDDWQTSTAVNRRAVEDESRRRHWGFNYERVGTQFRTREEFIAHLRGLPERRPTDFFVRFVAEGTVAEVREGECRVHAPWVFSVCSVASPDDGWSRSHVGVARTHPSLTPDRLHTSVRLIQQNAPHFAP